MTSWLFISLVVTILLTPGPTNTLLASSGIESGIRNSLKLIPAEVAGYLIAISTWGILIDSIAHKLPILPPLMKLLSATYIIFLALKLWQTSHIEDKENQISISVKALFCATLLNPKALLFASGVFPASSWKSLHEYIIHISIFLILIIPIAMLWVFIGSILVSNRISWLNQRNLKRTASIILISFSIPLSYSALTSF
ncbi:LysE family transporter [Acinetobacter sp. ME22]|uniref:LysE family translocator n=1 Tax=Acinetobacter sp. ME22 TaxID=2904802 RepID=UPI001EDC3A78|nr:LysE family transporter [Acinetobacter sp. ME22]MCG2574611.1 LysE family transporter [Acinetobacter sp. ME22]